MEFWCKQVLAIATPTWVVAPHGTFGHEQDSLPLAMHGGGDQDLVRAARI